MNIFLIYSIFLAILSRVQPQGNVGIGDFCSSDSECIGWPESAECSNGQCWCLVNFLPLPPEDNADLLCLPILNEIGLICRHSAQCQQGNPGWQSECSELEENPGNKVCNCQNSAVVEPGQHVCLTRANLIGDGCQVEIQCEANLGEFSECILPPGECQCETRSVPNKANNKCLPIQDEIGGDCEESVQCQQGDPGDLSECILEEDKNVCKCTQEGILNPAHQDFDRCYEKATKLGDPCTFDEQCQANLGIESECSDESESCQCKPEHIPNPGQGGAACIFLEKVDIGQPCKFTEQCLGIPHETSECSENEDEEQICVCMDGFVASQNNKTCLDIIEKLGEVCAEPQQCQMGKPGALSNCLPHSGISPKTLCTCVEEAINENGGDICYLKAEQVGDPCEVDIQCEYNLGQSECKDNSCICKINAVPVEDGSKCLGIAYLEETCFDKEQCKSHIPHSDCLPLSQLEAVCRCVEGFVHPPEINYECYQLAGMIGADCSKHGMQCDELEGVICMGDISRRTCECEDETDIVSLDGKQCLDSRTELNKTCNEDAQCSIDNSECLLNPETNLPECICKRDGFVESWETPGKCLPIVEEINLPCEESVQCKLGIGDISECRAGSCQCVSGYVYYGERCLVGVGLGDPCSSNLECEVGVNNLTECIPPVNRCGCVEGSLEHRHSCWLEKRVGDSCRESSECQLTIFGNVTCDFRTSTCMCAIWKPSDFGGNLCSVGANLLAISYLVVLPISIFIFELISVTE